MDVSPIIAHTVIDLSAVILINVFLSESRKRKSSEDGDVKTTSADSYIPTSLKGKIEYEHQFKAK